MIPDPPNKKGFNDNPLNEEEYTFSKYHDLEEYKQKLAEIENIKIKQYENKINHGNLENLKHEIELKQLNKKNDRDLDIKNLEIKNELNKEINRLEYEKEMLKKSIQNKGLEESKRIKQQIENLRKKQEVLEREQELKKIEESKLRELSEKEQMLREKAKTNQYFTNEYKKALEYKQKKREEELIRDKQYAESELKRAAKYNEINNFYLQKSKTHQETSLKKYELYKNILAEEDKKKREIEYLMINRPAELKLIKDKQRELEEVEKRRKDNFNNLNYIHKQIEERERMNKERKHNEDIINKILVDEEKKKMDIREEREREKLRRDQELLRKQLDYQMKSKRRFDKDEINITEAGINNNIDDENGMVLGGEIGIKMSHQRKKQLEYLEKSNRFHGYGKRYDEAKEKKYDEYMKHSLNPNINKNVNADSLDILKNDRNFSKRLYEKNYNIISGQPIN